MREPGPAMMLSRLYRPKFLHFSRKANKGLFPGEFAEEVVGLKNALAEAEVSQNTQPNAKEATRSKPKPSLIAESHSKNTASR